MEDLHALLKLVELLSESANGWEAVSSRGKFSEASKTIENIQRLNGQYASHC